MKTSNTAFEQPLRYRAFTGGVYLFIRRAFAMILQVIGIAVLTRLLGPDTYGLYYSAQGIYTFLSAMILMGIDVYLIREKGETFRDLQDTAFWWLLIVGTLTAGASITASVFGLFKNEQLQVLLPFMLALLPLDLIRAVPQSQLERALDYRYTAFLEIGGLLIFYLVGIGLALIDRSYWALIVGFAASQIFQTVGYFWSTHYIPRRFWRREHLKPMLHFGFTLSLAGWISNVRNLVPAIIILPFVGESAVGYFAMAERLLGPLSFSKEIISRLARPIFAQLQDDLARLLQAMTEAVQLQTLALGLTLAGFGLISIWVLPSVLGQQWDIPLLLKVFSFSAARVLVSGIFALQGSALAVKKYNWVSVQGNIAFAIVLLGGSYFAVKILPEPYKLFGVLMADFTAFMVGYLYKNYYLARLIGRPNYGITPLWTLAMLFALLAPVLSFWFYVPAAVLMLMPQSVRELHQLYLHLRQMRARRRSARSI